MESEKNFEYHLLLKVKNEKKRERKNLKPTRHKNVSKTAKNWPGEN